MLKGKTTFWFHLESPSCALREIDKLGQLRVWRQAITLILLGRLVILVHFVHLELSVLFFGFQQLVQRVDAQIEVNFDSDQDANADDGQKSFKDTFMIKQHFEAFRYSSER